MELPILLLTDSLNQQREQLILAEKNSTKANNEKQVELYNRAIQNLKGFIAELESAIKILNEHTGETRTLEENKDEKEFCDCTITYGALVYVNGKCNRCGKPPIE